MKKNAKKLMTLCVLALSLSIYKSEASYIRTEYTAAPLSNTDPTLVGTGSFTYQDYQPFSDRPINVRYHVPANQPNAPILFLMHGNSRNAQGYFDTMLKQAKKYNFILIVPEFDAKQYPSRDYHRGGIVDAQNKVRNREEWTFSMIEPLFDYVKKHTGNTSSGYLLYGFSAGSQFVHRYVMFNPDSRIIRAVSVAAGTYTMPDYHTNYSYGLKGVDLPQKDLNKFFAKDFMVAVGEADTVLSRSDLVKTPVANRQGRDRVERAQTFYNRAKEMAEKQKVPFNWRPVRLIPNAGHSQSDVAEAVAKILFEEK